MPQTREEIIAAVNEWEAQPRIASLLRNDHNLQTLHAYINAFGGKFFYSVSNLNQIIEARRSEFEWAATAAELAAKQDAVEAKRRAEDAEHKLREASEKVEARNNRLFSQGLIDNRLPDPAAKSTLKSDFNNTFRRLVDGVTIRNLLSKIEGWQEYRSGRIDYTKTLAAKQSQLAQFAVDHPSETSSPAYIALRDKIASSGKF